MMTPEDLIKAIPSWTLKDVMQAVDGIKETLGISDIDVAAASVSAPTQAAAPAAEEKTEFSVMLAGFGEGKKLNVIKKVRTITGIPVGDAKKIVDDLGSAPYEVKADLPKAEAEALKKEIEEVGGVVEIK